MLSSIVTAINDIAVKRFHWTMDNDTFKIYKTPLIQKTPTTIHFDQIQFKCNLFFEPIIKITTLKTLPVSNGNVSNSFQFTLNSDQRQLLSKSSQIDGHPIYQIRFFCSKLDHSLNNLLVEFPPVCEIRLNGNTISATTLRVLKNKPGTVNPPDITIMTRKKDTNRVELVHGSISQSYIAGIFIVKRTPIQAIINEIKKRRISKESILKELQERQENEQDIALQSQTLLMKCPLAFSRIKIPIRSIHCHHLQCFDANTFLLMNEQRPTWACPVCNIKIESYNHLILDGYFMEILKNTPKHIESVNVEPNGHIVIVDEHPSLSENQEDTDNDEQEEKDAPAIVELSDDDDNLSIPSSPKSTQQQPASATVDLISSDEEDG
ncbi:hypothetical protein G6F43_007166 [Rhizopus delemar]|nr:hypothetical protein G6F43_007166 [Rhizopus delemar]